MRSGPRYVRSPLAVRGVARRFRSAKRNAVSLAMLLALLLVLVVLSFLLLLLLLLLFWGSYYCYSGMFRRLLLLFRDVPAWVRQKGS